MTETNFIVTTTLRKESHTTLKTVWLNNYLRMYKLRKINMADMSNENLRRFPNYGDRRNKGTNPEEAGEYQIPLDYADNIPVEVDMRVDISQHMNTLSVREYKQSDLIGNNSRPTIHGASLSREELEQHEVEGRVTRSHDPALLDGKLPGFRPAMVRQMMQLAHTAVDPSVSAAMKTRLDNAGIPSSTTYNSSGDGRYIFGHPRMGNNQGISGATSSKGIGSFGLFAGSPDKWVGTTGVIPAKNLVQLLLTGTVNASSYEVRDVLSLVSTGYGQNDANLFNVLNTTVQVPFAGNTQAGRNANLDTMALSMCYSSFLDFVIDWQDSIENLCHNLKYLKGEFVGFFERGFKSHFWQRFSTEELVMLCWAVQLGQAIRRGRWADNLHQIDQKINGDSLTDNSGRAFAGVWHPLYMRLNGVSRQGSTDSNVKTEWSAPGLLRYLDEMSYECGSYDEPERGIYVEDLLTGLDIIMDEASREAGLGWRSIGRGYMEFFEDFKTATITDLRSTEARTDTGAIRIAQHLGYDDVTPIATGRGRNSGVGINRTWWSSFMDKGGIIETDRKQRLINDIDDLSSMSFLTGSKFNAGMQLAGLSKTRVFHREDMNGNEHSIDLTLDPECKMQLVNFEYGFNFTGHDVLKPSQGTYPQSSSGPGKARPRLVICWPSSGQGYAVYASNALHPIGHVGTGDWYTGSSSDLSNANFGYGRGYGHVCLPDGTLVDPRSFTGTGASPVLTFKDGNATDRHAMPMFGEMYYDISPGGWFPSLMKSLSLTYEYWQTAQNDTPFKSRWTGSGIEGINLVGMLSMSTGEALIQSNLPSLLHGTFCGANSADHPWRLESNMIDRKLHDSALHARPTRFSTDVIGMDGIGVLLPEGIDAAGYLEGKLMLDVILALQGTLRSGQAHPTRDDAYYSPSSFAFGNAEANTLDFIAKVGSQKKSWSANVRTIYMGEQLLNGKLLNYRITPLMYAENENGDVVNHDVPFFVSWNSGQHNTMAVDGTSLLFDFQDEIVAPEPTVFNAAHCVPGMRQWFGVFYTLSPNAASSPSNSPCTIFGKGTSALSAGSKITGMLGYGTGSSEVTTFVNETRAYQAVPDRPVLNATTLATITTFDTELFMEYVAARRGIEYAGSSADLLRQLSTPLYNRTPFTILYIDQDHLDTLTRMQAANLFLSQRQVLIFSTAHAVVSKSGDVTYTDGLYSLSSGGGVAQGSTFDTSDVDEDSDYVKSES